MCKIFLNSWINYYLIISHRKKRMKQLKKQISRGVYDPNRDDPFELFITSTNIRWCYYKESHKILGNTYGMLVLQVSQSRSFTAWLDLTVLRTRTLRPLPRTFWHEQLKPSKEGVLSYYCSRLWPRSNNSTLCPWQVPKHMVNYPWQTSANWYTNRTYTAAIALSRIRT